MPFQQRLAALVQEQSDLPWVVSLDLTSSDVDTKHLSPALVVSRIDPPEDEMHPDEPQSEPPSFYLCLLADNRCVALSSMAVLQQKIATVYNRHSISTCLLRAVQARLGGFARCI